MAAPFSATLSMLPGIVSVSSTRTWPLSSSSSGMGGGEWCFCLRGVMYAAGAVLVEVIPSDRLGIEGEVGADVDWADGSVLSSL